MELFAIIYIQYKGHDLKLLNYLLILLLFYNSQIIITKVIP